MKILHTVHIFLPHKGGSEYAVYWLSRMLAERGHEVSVATSTMGGGPVWEMMDDFEVLRFKDANLYKRFVMESDFDVRMFFGYNVASTDDLASSIDHMPRPWVFVPCGRIVESKALWQILHAQPDALIRLTTREPDGILIPLGVSLREFASAEPGFKASLGIRGPMILHEGGYWQNKRIRQLIEAMREVGDATLVCVGNGPRSDYLALAGPKVILLDALERSALLSAYLECDIVVSASSFEGFGLYMLEAMASGKPWVSTNVGATVDLPGGLVADEPQEIGPAVQDLISNPGWYEPLMRQAEAALPNYDWPVIATRYEELYKTCMENAKA